MQFTIRQNTLLNTIQTVSKAVAVRTTKQVLTGILLQATEKELTATAYDLDLGIQDTVPANEETGLRIAQPGQIVLPARLLTDLVRKLPSSEIQVTVHTNYVTEIRAGSAQFHIHGIDAAEFPTLPVLHAPETLQISAPLLKDIIHTTGFAISTVEARPILTGVHVECKNQALTFTATDGLRLATRTVRLEIPEEFAWNVVIPGKSLNELAKILPDDEQVVVVQFTDTHCLFQSGSTLFYTRLIEGTYPDTKRIIPKTYQTEVAVVLDDMLGAIDRASLIARERENHMVRMEVHDDVINVSSSSPELGHVLESVGVVEKTGEDLFIAFNARYVMDALRASSAAEVLFRFNGANQPFTIVTRGDESAALQLISPVLVR
ncbi:DNA polymerase III subunit beta [Alicyclobacillus cellulosilyticus]|uniref:Beta sliding clamp n=1 Tax=Alicyclobacillus cellulosilyticus TaxID=1003997 RepID=A0A917K1L2_9BACL|nr:DNA polymerase III subunit beta [Alicyclobacillus cellulosilyticus]GGI95021.1 DNA polymerase III subunit beta [Alicyclobacillus cellulosilyticus]